MAAAAKIDAEGLRVFAKQMRALSPKLGGALTAELKAIGNEVRDHVRSSTAPPYRTGTLRRSTKASATQRGVSIYSLLPQAPVHQWGGTISPRGAPIHIARTEYVTKQVEQDTAHVEERLGGLLDGMASRYAGFTP